MLTGKKFLLGITGSIAAYKTPLLVRQLVKEGAEVRVVMTKAAEDFVTPLTLATVSKNRVLTDLFAEGAWNNHVELGRWADLMLLAPLSCNTLAKMASGLCDNLLMATYLSATCPVWVAPAMDEDMWKHSTTKNNLRIVEEHGCRIIPVEHGELASGLVGDGRMAEPEAVVALIKDFFFESRPLAGLKALVTAGPTYESIDPVRFIGNHSSGKMGYAVAEALQHAGAHVTLVSGPVSGPTPAGGVELVKVQSAEEMYDACMNVKFDIAVMAAAVADYQPVQKAAEKIKKAGDELTLNLKKTPDILCALGEKKTGKQLLIGFALETNDEQAQAQKKLKEKNADMIVLNSLRDTGAGFGGDQNKITIYYRDGHERSFSLKPKTAVAKDIVDSIIELLS